MDQRGANWVAGGEGKALQRIIPPVVADDAEDDAPPPRTHNGPPAVVFDVSAEEAALEAQAVVVETALAESRKAEGFSEDRRIRTGRELVRLQQIFLGLAKSRIEKICNLRDEGHSWTEIGDTIGIKWATVAVAYRRTKDQTPQKLESTLEGRLFYKWAQHRFSATRKKLSYYMAFGRRGEVEVRRTRNKNKGTADRRAALITLIRAKASQKTTPTVFKKAFMALQPPARKATLLWACSTVIGSEDPQEIARWFADAMRQR